ncbi:MAG: YidC/Oxa1 family membrane protein insertase [Oscillospiraceae bacterium]|nr:YidC/Oxa1 family membrane protein insertase [Oscillospiraceae bacterium]
MTFGSMLGTFLIGPLKFVFEIIFQLVYEWVQDPGLCIIALSLAMNFLVLPLYRRADAVQEQARDREAALAPGVAHIKKTFSGNERMMMLQTYYRQNRYLPLNAFSGSVSLLLEIPFFMAAYQFLSNLPLLNGTAFWMIRDLGAPDRLLSLGSLPVNVLPILMTLINFASAAIYLKGFPLKTKIRTYAIAVAFLVLLYNSPAGLVFYWTLNNVFSLLKNIVTYYVLPRIRAERAKSGKPAEKKAGRQKTRPLPQPDGKLFFLAAAFLTVLVGAFIPSVFISASPQEYVDLTHYFSPLWYNVSALLLAAGFFLLWFGVFYWLASPRGKVIFERILVICAILGAVNYMFFGTNLGILSASLRYAGGVSFLAKERILNGVVFVGAILLVLLLAKKLQKVFPYLLTISLAALLVMTGINTASTRRALKDLDPREAVPEAHFTISREGKNVVVLFLDRAMGEYVPYLLQEKPELTEIFDGFTWYSNTISFGGHTNMCAPALMGGYEYTPVELNKRDTERLLDKHNEALKVLPVLFMNNGYGVTVCDAPYANYKWIPDLSIYDEYPSIRKFITKGAFSSEDDKDSAIRNNLRNFFAFSWMKTLPLELQPVVYDSGSYLIAGSQNGSVAQIRTGLSRSHGMDQGFLDPFNVLRNLSHITKIEDGGTGQYLFFYNDAPHEPMMLQEPDYLPALTVDNSTYDEAHRHRFTANGKTLIVENGSQMIHYQANMASLLQIGSWLQYLRDNGVYDNTRIIIVSDHGYYLGQNPDREFTRRGKVIDTESYYPLLMVKDFNARGFRTSDEFMTNADVPALAVEGVIADPVNPFTGKRITTEEKTAHDQYIMTSREWHVNDRDTVFAPSGWAIIRDDINARQNWRFIDQETVLKEYPEP